MLHAVVLLRHAVRRLMENAAAVAAMADADVERVRELERMLGDCEKICIAFEQATEDGKGVGAFREFVGVCMKALDALPVDKMMFLPGGWCDGNGADSHVVHVVERTAPERLSALT